MDEQNNRQSFNHLIMNAMLTQEDYRSIGISLCNRELLIYIQLRYLNITVTDLIILCDQTRSFDMV